MYSKIRSILKSQLMETDVTRLEFTVKVLHGGGGVHSGNPSMLEAKAGGSWVRANLGWPHGKVMASADHQGRPCLGIHRFRPSFSCFLSFPFPFSSFLLRTEVWSSSPWTAESKLPRLRSNLGPSCLSLAEYWDYRPSSPEHFVTCELFFSPLDSSEIMLLVQRACRSHFTLSIWRRAKDELMICESFLINLFSRCHKSGGLL